MAERKQGWITLDSCIYDYINRAELSQNKYFKLFHIAFSGMEDMGLDFFYQIKSIKLPINANKTVTLPSDYLNYTKIGVLNGVGELIPLKYNDKLTSFADLNPNRIVDTTSTSFVNFYSYSSPIFYNFWNGYNYSNLYGIASVGLYGGGFKVDEANGVIILDASFNYDGLVIEYTASPQEGEDYYIPVEFRQAMINWLAWQDIINLPPTRRGAINNVRDRRHEYFEARRRGMQQYRPFYLDQAYLENLGNSRLVVKA